MSTLPRRRSCITCKRRKVRCNRLDPCSNCSKAAAPCIYPTRNVRKAKDRTERLEDVAELRWLEDNTNAQVVEEHRRQRKEKNSPSVDAGQNLTYSRATSVGRKREYESIQTRSMNAVEARILVTRGEKRYMGSKFWASQSGEEIESSVDSNSSLSVSLSPEMEALGEESSNVLGFGIVATDDSALIHPNPAQSMALVLAYEENCDSLLKITHRPTMRNIFISAGHGCDKISKSQEALLFSMYFGAVCSLNPRQCRERCGAEKRELLKRFSRSTGIALHRAGLLTAPTLESLQALVLILIFMLSVGNLKTVWTLSGLAFHIARSLGLHRDGRRLGLSPFETEMRRRLWWNITILDSRFAEEHGAEPSFTEKSCDTELPSNINDDEISPETREFPQSQKGFTDTTFCLVRFELNKLKRRLGKLETSQTEREPGHVRVHEIARVQRLVREKYLKYCSTSIPLQVATVTVAQTILSKISFTSQVDAFHPKEKSGQKDLLVQAAKWVQMSYSLEINSDTQKWVWFFRSYVPWHGIAYILSELTENPCGFGYEAFWNVVQAYLDSRAKLYPSATDSPFWKLVQRLLESARRAKEDWCSTHSVTSRDHQVDNMICTNMDTLQHLEFGVSSTGTENTSIRPQYVFTDPKSSGEDTQSYDEVDDNWSNWAEEFFDLPALTTVPDDLWNG